MSKLQLTILAWALSLTPLFKKQLRGLPHNLMKPHVKSSGHPPALCFAGPTIKPQSL